MRKILSLLTSATLLLGMGTFTAFAQNGGDRETIHYDTVQEITEDTTFTNKDFVFTSNFGFKITKSAILTFENCSITINAKGSSSASVTGINVAADHSVVNFNHSELYVSGNYSRGITCLGLPNAAGGYDYATDVSINVNDSKIISRLPDGQALNVQSRGICYTGATAETDSDAPKVNVLVKDSEISGFAYCIQPQSVTPGAMTSSRISIEDSTLSGWAALYLYPTNGHEILVKNSTLKGTNPFSGEPTSANSFSTVVFEGVSLQNTLVLENTQVVAVQNGNMYQYGLSYTYVDDIPEDNQKMNDIQIKGDTAFVVENNYAGQLPANAMNLRDPVNGGILPINSVEALKQYADLCNVTIDPAANMQITIDSALRESQVTASADISYVVVIPETVDFGKVDKSMETAEQPFTVQVTDALLEEGASITVKNITAAEDMVMKNKDGAGTKTLPFELAQADGLFTFTQAELEATGQQSIESSVTCSPKQDLKAAGSYKGYMTFEVTYVPAA